LLSHNSIWTAMQVAGRAATTVGCLAGGDGESDVTVLVSDRKLARQVQLPDMPDARVLLAVATACAVALLRRGFRPRTTAILLVLWLPLLPVLSSVVALGAALLPALFAWGTAHRTAPLHEQCDGGDDERRGEQQQECGGDRTIDRERAGKSSLAPAQRLGGGTQTRECCCDEPVERAGFAHVVGGGHGADAEGGEFAGGYVVTDPAGCRSVRDQAGDEVEQVLTGV
jgi:hypothetical protein